MTYDVNGVLEVEATIVETGKRVRAVIARHAHGLSEEQIAEAVERMQAFKTHPREETENRLLLRRAERLYRELPFRERDRLGDLLDGFEEALDMQDQPAIARLREHLESFLGRFEHDETEGEWR